MNINYTIKEYDTASETQTMEKGDTVSILICLRFSEAYLGL